MSFNSNQSINRFCYFSKKRFFITILLIYAFLSCVHYIHEQIEQPINSNTTIWNDIFNRQHQHNQDLNKPIEFIKNILENEYNQTDLKHFYNLVKKEYSLGLKCTRKENLSQTILKSNVTNPFTNKKRKTPAKSSLLFSNQKHSNRHYQRTNLNKYIIDNSNACFNQSIDLLVIIISKSDNYKTRDAIRRTWASGNDLGKYSSINIKFFFLIDYDEKLSESIRLENELFHDIIQVQLPQQYTLVTYRVLSLIEWSFRYCRNAKYLFKTDDDIFINLILLLKFISPLLNQPINNSFLISDMTLYGYPHVNAHVFRYSKSPVLSRYIVTNDEFPCEKYPTYLTGYGYLIPKKGRDAILYTAYQDPRPFRVSDVYFAGIIPNYLSIPVQRMSRYFIRGDGDCDNFFNKSNAYACATASHHGKTTDVFQQFNDYWQLIKDKHGLI